ncbi:uncharacterized protein LOC124920407 [Impatiens glandulifera]|uniref:uncharacterized protein LOC124920407 n=1 Tax=Impatiens glandulifera TaxID=253017 RepID=UPI001FB0CCC8|nr:uncharacterized protein LOC124920407 [Impatiens glandulifera]
MNPKKMEAPTENELEILKAVAQARQGRAGNSPRSTSEFDAHRLKFTPKPSRFRIEAMKSKGREWRTMISRNWDFGQSLLDSHEIVAVSKRIEQEGLVLEKEIEKDIGRNGRKNKRGESKNSLRNLFNRVSSRWYNNNNDNDVTMGYESD